MSWASIAKAMTYGDQVPNFIERKHKRSGTVQRWYVLSNGEEVTPVELARDDRNVHGLSDSAFRRRLDALEKDPERLFWSPDDWRNRNRIAMQTQGTPNA